MRKLQITLFVIALVTLASQTFRHAYIRWLEPRASVLDKYDTQTEQQIASAKSLDELVALFDAAHAKVLEYEKAHPPEDEAEKFRRLNRETEPFKSEGKLRDAIKDWEQKSREIRELWHFWLAGIVALAIGLGLSFKPDRWIAMAFVILAFAEMIWATSPTLSSLGGAKPEFDRLLVQKFALSLVSLGLLLFAWFVAKRRESGQP